jgi:hypothetical protein
MTEQEWKETLDKKCDDIVHAYSDLGVHIKSLKDVDDISDHAELIAHFSVSLLMMGNKIDNLNIGM